MNVKSNVLYISCISFILESQRIFEHKMQSNLPCIIKVNLQKIIILNSKFLLVLEKMDLKEDIGIFKKQKSVL